MVTLHMPRHFPDMAALLLSHGANTQVRASISKPTVDSVGWANLKEVTAVEYAQNFIYPDLINRQALELVERWS